MISADSRDYTKAPPAYLDPHFVLLMRERLRNWQATGQMEWYEERIRDWSPARPGRFAPDGTSNNNGGN